VACGLDVPGRRRHSGFNDSHFSNERTIKMPKQIATRR
jgi:hypothetical protein